MEEQVRSDLIKESSSEQSSPAAAAAAAATESGVSAEGDKDKEAASGNVEALICWLYVSRTAVGQNGQVVAEALPRRNLEEAIRTIEPSARWTVSETNCGLMAGFARESDADKLLQREDFGRIFQTPVQVARFCDRDSRHRQAVLLRDVPAAIPLQDIDSALARQGIASGAIERLKHYVRVEVLEASHYEQILRHGLDFFGATRFCAIPERWRGNSGGGGGGGGGGNGNNNNSMASALGNYGLEGGAMQQFAQQQQQQNLENVLQCYRCQGFWHVAANCRHLPRCVRCGEPHNVEFCTRPRNNPVCCHCSGPHHAGYRQCPVRLQLINATPVSLTLSASRSGGGGGGGGGAMSASQNNGNHLSSFVKSSGNNNSNSSNNQNAANAGSGRGSSPPPNQKTE